VRGGWRFVDTGLEPGKIQLVLVNASAACAKWIEAIKPDSGGTYAADTLPGICPDAARVSITVIK
jgi:hypothetical protein